MRVVVAHAGAGAAHEALGRLLPEGLGQLAGRAQQLAFVARDETSIQLGLGEGAVADHPAQEGQVGAHAADGGVVEHGQQAQARFLAVLAPGDQLAEHRVVERRHRVALGDAAVHPAPRPGGRFAVQVEGAGGGQEVVVRVLGVQAHLDGVAAQRHLFLADRQRLAPGDTDLPGDQVQAGDGLGDRVLHLQAGVHLHEEELATRVQQEFHGAGADIADGLGGLHRRFAHGAAQRRGHAGRRGFLDHLLVAALDRAVALVEVQAVAVLVGEYLDLHVARLEDIFLHQHARVAERRLRLALRGGQRLGQIRLALDHLHALAAAAGGGLEQHRIANHLGGGAEGFQVLGLAVVARHQRHAGGFHQCLGRGLAAHGVDGRGGRAEEDQPGLFDGAGELGVFREKAVARVDGLGAAGFRRFDQLVDAQVTVGRFGAAQVDADVRLAGMSRIGVDGAVHGDGGQAEGLGGAHHPAGDLAAVGHQQGIDGTVHGWFSCQAGMRFSRKALRPSWPSGLVRRRAMACSVVWRSAAS